MGPNLFGNQNPFCEPSACQGVVSPYYSDSHTRLRRYVRDFVDTEINPNAADWEEAGEVPKYLFERFVAAGFVGPSVPRKYRGGARMPADVEVWDVFHEMIMSDELARASRLGPLWAVSSGNRIALPLITVFGTEEQKSTWLPAACTGRLRFCLAVTEPDGGSDVANITTTAERISSSDGYKVNGQKKWITNGCFADYAVTAVRTGGPGVQGISVLLVPLKQSGVVLKKMKNSGVEASGSTFIDFEDVIVPPENLLGHENEGFKVLMSNFDAERLGLAISGLRVARTCLSEAYLHATSRRTFGKFLIEHDIIKAKFAQLARMIEAQHAWHEQLCFQVKTNGHKTTSGRIALAKVQSSLILEKACREAQQVFGGLSFSKGGRGGVVEQIARDLRVFVVGGGSAEILEGQGFKLEMKESSRRKGGGKAPSKL